ncbi:ubiquitin carboxyl-terminal hydrolase-like faf isoform X2 [Amblyomma americanum]
MTARGNPLGGGGGDQDPPPATNQEEQQQQQQQQQPQQQQQQHVEESGGPLLAEPLPTVVSEEQQQPLVVEEEEFPLAELVRLDEMINRPRWVVPVLAKGELEVLLEAAIRLCRQGRDVNSEPCQRFFREGLTISFTKILTDEAVSGWKFEIHRCIMKNCERLVELCVTKLHQDWFPLLELLAMVLNPHNKFHSYNGTRPSDTVPPGSQIPDDEIYARPTDTRTPKGWVVDLINRFGSLGGFSILLERFRTGPPLSVAVIAALVRPFGLCHSLLTVGTVERYLMPIVHMVPAFLERLSDEELKREAKNESKNDALAAIVRALRSLAAMVPRQEETVRSLEMFRLRMILRLLQISSFNGKMNALNEVNKVIANVSYYAHRHTGTDEEEWLTAERMAEWIKENRVLQIVLRDSLHQPQYVEKLEKIVRFVIKEKALTLADLDDLWAAQSGKHEAIVQNVHDLLAKLAWDFSPEQLDHLFGCFQASWASAAKRQREKLLELIRRLAEDDKEGLMAHKVLQLLWNLAHSREVPTDTMELALSFHVKILDYSCSQDRDAQKTLWLDRCVQELRQDPQWALPALRHMQEVAGLYSEAPLGPAAGGGRAGGGASSAPGAQALYRHEVINRLQQQHSLVVLVADGLSAYMAQAQRLVHERPDPTQVYGDSRYSHVQQVQERLKFLRFLLKDGQLWLCAAQAKQIWHCLAENAVYPTDREACFKWFSKLMGEEPDLDPEINQDFFEQNVLQLDPALLTESGLRCFERFFRAVNCRQGRLLLRRRTHLLEDPELLGADYLWRVVLHAQDGVADRAIDLLRETYTHLGPRLQGSRTDIHEDLVQSCMDRLKAAYDTVCALQGGDEVARRESATRMVRVLRVLSEYVAQCDGDFPHDRAILPMARAHRGRQVVLTVRFPSQGRQVEDVELVAHTNDTLGAIRRQIYSSPEVGDMCMVKVNNASMKVDLFLNTELLDPAEDKKLIGQLPIKDKAVLSAKLSQLNAQLPSSPESSSDSSVGSPQHQYDGPHAADAEACLPGVLMSKQHRYSQFLFKLADLGSALPMPELRDSALGLLKILPADVKTVERLRELCEMSAHQGEGDPTGAALEGLFQSLSPTELLYHLEVAYSLLLPALSPFSKEAQEFQAGFVRSGGVAVVLRMLGRQDSCCFDPTSRGRGSLLLLKLSKLLLTVVGHCLAHQQQTQALQQGPPPQTQQQTPEGLAQALKHVPSMGPEGTLHSVGVRLAPLLRHQGTVHLPDLNTIQAVIKLAWASAGLVPNGTTVEGSSEVSGLADEELCQEALEVLTLALSLQPTALSQLLADPAWARFVLDLLLHCPHRSIRQCAADQLCLIATKCSTSQQCLLFLVDLLFAQLPHLEELAGSCQELFGLLCRLLGAACRCPLPALQQLLEDEIAWLKRIREKVQETGGLSAAEESLLEGHLGVARELVSLLSPTDKHHIGSDPGNTVRGNLVKELLEDFAFPASRVEAQLRSGAAGDGGGSASAVAVCPGPDALRAALDLLVALCTQSPENLAACAALLSDMFYAEGQPPLQEWEYLPPVGPRPRGGFVGLKNAGATCYMNSVLQQLYMIDSIREGILAVEGAATDPNEDFSGEERPEHEGGEACMRPVTEEDGMAGKEEQRRDYHLGVLKQVQAVFGHLAASQLQYYVPRGFWRHFKLWGEPVNLREQHDALEFFNSLVDSLDEALKALGAPCLLAKALGGTFADQKICRGCPHRYSREESFTTLNIDIRNHSNLLDSLEQYVKGDLLEGANAYHCDKCNKKVDTVKRLCIKKLPPILAIQLKRFDYDWERECAIKFNDYFEFPRELDMEPYTVRGLARMEGELMDDEEAAEADELGGTHYRLTGIVVHSGQASGGHYYSYILTRPPGGAYRWYKFDDGEVSECRMDEEEEMKNQCFGGEYMGEVFDHMLKRMSYRRQKRWWNAYILFYQRTPLADAMAALSMQQTKVGAVPRMPAAIERSVWRQNIKFLHTRNQFSHEYFQFTKKLVSCNTPFVALAPDQDRLTPEAEDLAMVSVQLASKFLFQTAFHTKKSLRGSASDWYEVLCVHLRHSRNVRLWFANQVLFAHPHRLAEYLLECPTNEVRSAFAKIVVFLAHASARDGPYTPLFPCASSSLLSSPNATLSDHLLVAVLSLVNKEVSEHGRHLAQYFGFFYMYACYGVAERLQLLRLNVLGTLMLVALDEGPGPPIKYQYADLSKLYQLVSLLVRCCDVSSKTHSCLPNGVPLPNPHMGDHLCQEYLMAIQPQVAACLYNKTSYVKKVIEDASASEETLKLLQFCSWENPQFSSAVLGELLWQVAYTYTYELRPFVDLLLGVLLLEDSWQVHRIHNALRGIPDDREGLFDTIQRSKNHYQKRAYQCVKCLVALFDSCPAAAHMLHTSGELKRKWAAAVDWLNDELERRPYGAGSQYGYSQWSPPAQSNETSNGYFLERSHSARLTLSRAIQLCPEEEPEEHELPEDGEGSGSSSVGGAPAAAVPLAAGAPHHAFAAPAASGSPAGGGGAGPFPPPNPSLLRYLEQVEQNKECTSTAAPGGAPLEPLPRRPSSATDDT